MKIAVVRNRKREGVINVFGHACPEVYGEATIRQTVEALVANGHEVLCLEGDKTLLAKLEQFAPRGLDEKPAALVFNMAYGIQGESRYTHVPAMLEMAGVPYTGASPLGHALALDKVITKIQIDSAGVPTPPYAVIRRPDDRLPQLRYPLVVKPRHESTSWGLYLVHDSRQLRDAAAAVISQYRQDALVEQYIDGREVCLGLLGNEPVECLPIVETDFGHREDCLVTWGDKMHKRGDEPEKICPADLPAELAARLRQLAVVTFRACHCRDYARVDVRIDRAGRPFVLEINSMASLGKRGSFVLAASKAGYDFTSLIGRVVDVAHQRYFGTPAAWQGHGVQLESSAIVRQCRGTGLPPVRQTTTN